METTEVTRPVDEVNFENPVAAPPGGIKTTHDDIVAGSDIAVDFVAGDLLVGKLAHEVPSVRAPVLPAGVPGRLAHVREQRFTGDVGVCEEELFGLGRHPLWQEGALIHRLPPAHGVLIGAP